MNDTEIEKEIQAKGLTAPRVTVAQIEQTLVAEAYITGDAIPVWLISSRGDHASVVESLSLLTVCVLVLKNGFTVVGASACASPDNFDEVLGRKVARQKAIDKIWALEGYRLKQELFEYPYGRPQPPGRDEEGR
jgi:Phage protein (N4 Gp49/phage Sf6 gene 66) family